MKWRYIKELVERDEHIDRGCLEYRNIVPAGAINAVKMLDLEILLVGEARRDAAKAIHEASSTEVDACGLVHRLCPRCPGRQYGRDGNEQGSGRYAPHLFAFHWIILPLD